MATVPLNSGMGGATQTATLGPEFKTYYQRNMLMNFRENLVHQTFGKKVQMPKGGGLTMEWRQVTPLADVTTPLQEGVTPDGQSFEVTATTVSLNQYGAYIKGTDVVTVVAFDNLLDEISTELGAQAGESIDIVTREALNAGTVVQYAGGHVARNAITAADILTTEELIKARATLFANKAKPSKGQYFGAIIGPLTHADLMRDSDANLAFNAGDHRSELFDGEIGRYMGIVFTMTNLAKEWAGAGAGGTVNVYSTLLFGRDAYAVLDLASLGLEYIFHPKGSAGSADPINQFWTSGWKTTHAVKILREQSMLRIEHAVTNG